MDVHRTGASVRRWFERGVAEGRRFLLVWQDRYEASHDDLGLYPMFAQDADEARRLIAERSGEFHRLLEILDLRMDLTRQLEGPPRTDVETFDSPRG